MRLTDFDWPEIILDLRRCGMGQHEIARNMGQAVGESMVRQYLAGASPAHWRGEILLTLWEERTGRDRDAAPRRPAEMRRISERRPRSRQTSHMPTEHLPAVAQAFGISVPDLLQLLHKRQRRVVPAGVTLSLPGFEE
ncbi:hypothetical protein [Achromobacter marplatensis]